MTENGQPQSIAPSVEAASSNQREPTAQERKDLVRGVEAREGDYLPYDGLHELRDIAASGRIAFGGAGSVVFLTWAQSLVDTNTKLVAELKVERERAQALEARAAKAEREEGIAAAKLGAERSSTHIRLLAGSVGSVMVGFAFTAYEKASTPGLLISVLLGAVLLASAYWPRSRGEN